MNGRTMKTYEEVDEKNKKKSKNDAIIRWNKTDGRTQEL